MISLVNKILYVWNFILSEGINSILGDIRVSESCNHAITRLRKILENLRKFWNNERKKGKNVTNNMYLSQVDNVFLVSFVFNVILMHDFKQKF